MNKSYELAKEVAIKLQAALAGEKIYFRESLHLNYHLEEAGVDISNVKIKSVWVNSTVDPEEFTQIFLYETLNELCTITSFEQDLFTTDFAVEKDGILIKFSISDASDEEEAEKYFKTKDGIYISTIPFILADELVGWTTSSEGCSSNIRKILDNFSFNLGTVMNLYYESDEELREGLKDEGREEFYPTFVDKIMKAKKYANWQWNPETKDWVTAQSTNGAKRMNLF